MLYPTSSVAAQLMSQLLTVAAFPAHCHPFLSWREIANNVLLCAGPRRIHLVQASNLGDSDSFVTTEKRQPLTWNITAGDSQQFCTAPIVVAVVADPLPRQFHFSLAFWLAKAFLRFKVISSALGLVSAFHFPIACISCMTSRGGKCLRIMLFFF